MKRRMYFLFPDLPHVSRAVAELHEAGFTDINMHVVARRGLDTRDLPRSNYLQLHDFSRLLENWAWRGNLILFFAALLALLVMLTTSPGWLWMVMVGVMAATLYLGYVLAQRLPNVHLNQFRGAIEHGEILLMVDTPQHRIKEVEDRIQRIHPEAVFGGIGWTIGMLRI